MPERRTGNMEIKAVYLTSHCPEGYESLELKRIMKLA